MKRWCDEDREDVTLSNASLNYLIKNYYNNLINKC